MRKFVLLTSGLIIICQTTAAFAKDKQVRPQLQQRQSISGNPIGGQDNFTINSNKEKNVSVECVFINTSKQPTEISIWTNPAETKAAETVFLQPGSKTKPTQVLKKYHLSLKNDWWCRIYTPPETAKHWGYCSYFSISDRTIAEHKPFSSWTKTIRSKETSYYCRLLKPKQETSFFYFES